MLALSKMHPFASASVSGARVMVTQCVFCGVWLLKKQLRRLKKIDAEISHLDEVKLQFMDRSAMVSKNTSRLNQSKANAPKRRLHAKK